MSDLRERLEAVIKRLRGRADMFNVGDAAKNEYERDIATLTKAIASLPSAIGDNVLVPREPTEAMSQAYYKGIAGAGSLNFYPVWQNILAAVPASPRVEAAHTRSAQDLIDYLDGFYKSGNEVPIDRPWINQATWKLAKELFAEGLPLDHSVIESEIVYRRKLATYGDDTRAQSPLEKLRASYGDSQP